MLNLSKTFHYGKDRRHFSFLFLLLTLYNFLDTLCLSSCFTHSLSLKKNFFFLSFFPFEYSSLFLLLYVPENIRLITSVCAHMGDRVRLRDIAVCCTCTIKLYVNTLPHAHGLLIKTCTKQQQRVHLFGINLSFWDPQCRTAFCNDFRPGYVQSFIITQIVHTFNECCVLGVFLLFFDQLRRLFFFSREGRS